MSKDEEEQESRGFKVEDRRRFVDREAAEAASGPASEPVTGPAAESGGRGEEPRSDGAPRRAAASAEGASAGLQEVTFSTFVMGLFTQALMHLGEVADPDGKVDRDLPAAKQMIDLLGILRDKTKGNLDAAEEQLLGSMLYDLRMRYVEVARQR